jgi:tRNA U55 pseudouridine synthase TruB
LQALVRERSGPFEIATSVSLEMLADACRTETTESVISAPDAVLSGNEHLFKLELDEHTAKLLSMGQTVECPGPALEAIGHDQRIMVCSGEWLLAICTQESGRLKAEVVINRGSREDS